LPQISWKNICEEFFFLFNSLTAAAGVHQAQVYGNLWYNKFLIFTELQKSVCETKNTESFVKIPAFL
jgi:hypothetical protein